MKFSLVIEIYCFVKPIDQIQFIVFRNRKQKFKKPIFPAYLSCRCIFLSATYSLTDSFFKILVQKLKVLKFRLSFFCESLFSIEISLNLRLCQYIQTSVTNSLNISSNIFVVKRLSDNSLFDCLTLSHYLLNKPHRNSMYLLVSKTKIS